MTFTNRSRKESMGKTYTVAILAVIVFAVAFGFLLDFIITKVEYATYKKPEEYQAYVSEYAKEYDVPEHIIYAVIKAESGFDPEARSGAGALGLMQLMPVTFEDLTDNHLREYLDSSKLYDPKVNIRYGVYYLSYLYRMFGNWDVVFAAYNGGLGNVREWLEDKQYSSDGRTLENIPIKETRNYVSRVNKNLEKYNELYGSLS